MENPHVFLCRHCGRKYVVRGSRTGFVQASFDYHEIKCGQLTPAERRTRNAKAERQWAKKGTKSEISHDPYHPGVQE